MYFYSKRAFNFARRARRYTTRIPGGIESITLMMESLSILFCDALQLSRYVFRHIMFSCSVLRFSRIASRFILLLEFHKICIAAARCLSV